jgi:hypothetical protein
MSPHTLVAIPAEFMGSYSNRAMEHLVTAADDGTLCLEIGGDVIAQLAFSGDLHFLIHDSFTGQWRHGRFLRDPVTRQVELLQIGGRLTARQLSVVLEARSPAGALSWVAMMFCSACSRGHCAGGLRQSRVSIVLESHGGGGNPRRCRRIPRRRLFHHHISRCAGRVRRNRTDLGPGRINV